MYPSQNLKMGNAVCLQERKKLQRSLFPTCLKPYPRHWISRKNILSYLYMAKCTKGYNPKKPCTFSVHQSLKDVLKNEWADSKHVYPKLGKMQIPIFVRIHGSLGKMFSNRYLPVQNIKDQPIFQKIRAHRYPMEEARGIAKKGLESRVGQLQTGYSYHICGLYAHPLVEPVPDSSGDWNT